VNTALVIAAALALFGFIVAGLLLVEKFLASRVRHRELTELPVPSARPSHREAFPPIGTTYPVVIDEDGSGVILSAAVGVDIVHLRMPANVALQLSEDLVICADQLDPSPTRPELPDTGDAEPDSSTSETDPVPDQGPASAEVRDHPCHCAAILDTHTMGDHLHRLREVGAMLQHKFDMSLFVDPNLPPGAVEIRSGVLGRPRRIGVEAKIEPFGEQLQAFADALDEEGVTGDVSRRILNRAIFGHPEGMLANLQPIELDPTTEQCRECADNGRSVPADFILWGKLLNPSDLGPRCYDCTVECIGHAAIRQVDQWAVYDLRPVRQLLSQRAVVLALHTPAAGNTHCGCGWTHPCPTTEALGVKPA
jgi:hypothetical protein